MRNMSQDHIHHPDAIFNYGEYPLHETYYQIPICV